MQQPVGRVNQSPLRKPDAWLRKGLARLSGAGYCFNTLYYLRLDKYSKASSIATKKVVKQVFLSTSNIEH